MRQLLIIRRLESGIILEMKCENLQFNLSIYLDNCLVEEERAVVDKHLAQCPLCRQKLADFQALRADLRVLPRPALSNNLLLDIRNRVAQAAAINQPEFSFQPDKSFQERFQMWLMPYCVGTAASLIVGLTLLWAMLSAVNVSENNTELAKYAPTAKPSILLAKPDADIAASRNDFDLSAADYAAARISVSGESPSLNPQGALVALTRSIVRGKMKDDEVVVVADVFGNGLAQIAEVVEPSKDVQAVNELQKALRNDPNYAPFVPAKFDNRSETVRVILKINRVDIETHTKSKYK